MFRNIKTTHFLRNRGQGFAQRLFPQMYTTFKGIMAKIFFLEAPQRFPPERNF